MVARTDPLVSIVLPIFNGARHLEQSILSCLQQTHQNWELILVDDASTDETPALLARYANQDERLRVIRHETNQRLPAALNTGFAQARGDYLTWTSDDNWYAPGALSLLVHYLEIHPDCDFVYTGFYRINEEQGTWVRCRPRPPQTLWQLNPVGPCFLYRRRVYDLIGPYNPELFLAEDYDYWLRISKHFTMHPWDVPLYYYRRHTASLSLRFLRPREQAARKARRWARSEEPFLIRIWHNALDSDGWQDHVVQSWRRLRVLGIRRRLRDWGHSLRASVHPESFPGS